MKFFDRLLTIIITATLTSAFWIVFGTAIMKAAEDTSAADPEAEAAPSAPAIAAPTDAATDAVPDTPATAPEPEVTAPAPAAPSVDAPETSTPADEPAATPSDSASEPEAAEKAADEEGGA